jgi:epsin
MIIYFRDNLYVIKTLEEFQYVDKDGKDQGGNVRAKARFISSLLQDEGLLLTERSELGSLRERIVKGAEESKASLLQEQLTAEEKDLAQVDKSSGDDIEMPRAIETSKASLRQEHHVMAEEQDLAEAIELSEEESRRLKAAEESNTKALFEDQHQLWVLNCGY